MELISSMKMMAGENFLASLKALQRLLTLASHFTGPLIKKEKALVSFATAQAIKVFPVPGGPNMRMPHGASLRFASSSSLLIGSPSGEE